VYDLAGRPGRWGHRRPARRRIPEAAAWQDHLHPRI